MDEEILAEFSSDQEAMEEEELIHEVYVVEEWPKKSTASEVRSLLTSYSLFVNEGAKEVRSHLQQIEALAKRTFSSSVPTTADAVFIFVPKQQELYG